jgi:hypothetical protein
MTRLQLLLSCRTNYKFYGGIGALRIVLPLVALVGSFSLPRQTLAASCSNVAGQSVGAGNVLVTNTNYNFFMTFNGVGGSPEQYKIKAPWGMVSRMVLGSWAPQRAGRRAWMPRRVIGKRSGRRDATRTHPMLHRDGVVREKEMLAGKQEQSVSRSRLTSAAVAL